MKFKLNEITKFQTKKLLLNEHYNIYFGDNMLDTDLVQVDENNCLLFSPDVPVIINDMYFDKGVLNLLEVNEYNIISIKDSYGNTIVSPITTSAQAAFVDIVDNSIVIKIEDRHRDYEDPLFPIFKVDYEYLNNDIYLGKLYVEFSPLTTKDKYLVYTSSGTLDYISSHFNIFVKDSMNSIIFNSLGLLNTGDTIFIANEFGHIEKQYTFFDLKDNNVIVKDPIDNDKFVEIPYTSFIYANNIFYYSQDDTLVYLADSENLHIPNDELKDKLSDISNFNIYTTMKNNIIELINTISSLNDEEKNDWNNYIDICKETFDKIKDIMSYGGIIFADNSSISGYSKIIYIDSDNTITEITNDSIDNLIELIDALKIKLE